MVLKLQYASAIMMWSSINIQVYRTISTTSVHIFWSKIKIFEPQTNPNVFRVYFKHLSINHHKKKNFSITYLPSKQRLCYKL